MSRPSDPKKLAVWRERFERLSRSGLTVAQLCARERVSVASFYHWRKKLGQAALRRVLFWGQASTIDLDLVHIAVIVKAIGLDISDVHAIEVDQPTGPIRLILQSTVDVQLHGLAGIGQRHVMPFAVINCRS